jgi:hypothetical protein
MGVAHGKLLAESVSKACAEAESRGEARVDNVLSDEEVGPF